MQWCEAAWVRGLPRKGARQPGSVPSHTGVCSGLGPWPSDSGASVPALLRMRQAKLFRIAIPSVSTVSDHCPVWNPPALSPKIEGLPGSQQHTAEGFVAELPARHDFTQGFWSSRALSLMTQFCSKPPKTSAEDRQQKLKTFLPSYSTSSYCCFKPQRGCLSTSPIHTPVSRQVGVKLVASSSGHP